MFSSFLEAIQKSALHQSPQSLIREGLGQWNRWAESQLPDSCGAAVRAQARGSQAELQSQLQHQFIVRP